MKGCASLFFSTRLDRRAGARLRFFSATFAAVVLAVPAIAQTATPSPAAFTPGTPAPSPTGPVEQVLLPRGTILVVKTLHSINSYGSESGAKLTFEVVQDAILDGHVIAQAGDVAEGAVQNAQAGENQLFNVKAANLRISVDTIFNFCGDSLHVDFVRSEFRQRQGFMGSHKDVEIAKGQLYQVPTERPQRVCAAKTAAQPLPMPSGALPGDKE